MEAFIEGQVKVLEMISANDPLPEILDAIIYWLEEQGSDDMRAAIYLTDEDKQHLLLSAAPNLPDAYNEAVADLEIAPGVGSCGTAAYLREQVLVEDISQDTLWKDYQNIAIAFDLHSCWSIPLIATNGRLLGTLAVYHGYPKKAGNEELQLMKLVSRIAVVAIEQNIREQEKIRLAINERTAIAKVNSAEQLAQLAVEGAGAGSFHLRLSDDRLTYSPAFSKIITGTQIDGLERKAFIKYIYPQDIPIRNRAYEEAAVTGKLQYEARFVWVDGSLHWVRVRGTYQKDEEGVATDFSGTVMDITEDKRKESELQDLQIRFQSIVMNAPTPIGVYIGKEMRIQIANDAILSAWHRDKSVIGKTFREALPELDGQEFYKLLDEVYTTGVPYIAKEARVDLLNEGQLKTYYFNFIYKALRDAEGNIFGVMNTASDVTDLVIARQELAKAEGQLRIAINSAELGTWTIDPRSGHAYISERVKEWYGLDEDAVDLQSGFLAIHENDREKVVNKFMETLKPGNSDLYEDEYRVVNLKNKEQRIIRATAKVFYDDNNEAYLVSGIVQDITKQKMNEQELENQVELRTKELQLANMQLQQTNQELEQFAYVASHDLQEPLRKIRMFSGILQTHPLIDNDPEGHLYFNKIVGSADRMTNLIKDLLHFSRVTAKEELFSKVDLNEIVRNVEHDFELLIQQKKASITIGELPTIEAIALQMNQLFYNLIGNALKFTSDNEAPVISISSRAALTNEIQQHAGLLPSEKYQLITISDQGIGFDSFLKEKIFTIFQRLNPRDKYEGTGIGLALCRKIVLAHGGAIWAESELNKGATFYILLPLNQH
jgi:PAS domain S-box-containing protein